MKICVVDDEGITLRVIVSVLSAEPNHQVEGFSDPGIAMQRCGEDTFDLVLVDYQMEEMNGIDCINFLRSTPEYKHVPIVMLTADQDRALRVAAVKAGATDFLSKPFDPEELRVRVRNLLQLRKAQLELMDRARCLDREVLKATRKLTEREEELIWRLARAIELRDGNTGEHISRVAKVSELIARSAGMDEDFCRTLYLAAPLHDAGKIAIPDSILTKTGKLTTQEMQVMRSHTEIGGHILAGGDSNLIQVAEEVALCHHEKWDGTGYSQQLAGEDIPLTARIVAISDVFDALCFERPYKKAWNFDDACDEVFRLSGTHFDPDLVLAFAKARSDIKEIFATKAGDIHAA